MTGTLVGTLTEFFSLFFQLCFRLLGRNLYIPREEKRGKIQSKVKPSTSCSIKVLNRPIVAAPPSFAFPTA